METTAARYPSDDRPERSPDRRPSIGEELDGLAKSTAILHETLDGLTDQLGPVLAAERPVPVDGDTQALDVVPTTAPLLNHVLIIRARLEEATRRVRLLQDRLQP